MPQVITPSQFAIFGAKQYHDAGNYGSSNVKVYIVDAELTNNLELPNVTIEDFTPGTDYLGEEHGNEVSCLLANKGTDGNHNGVTTIGVAHECTFTLGAVNDSNDDITVSGIVAALTSARQQAFDIITLSLGTYTDDSSIRNAVQLACNDGILVFAAAGNEAISDYIYPASYMFSASSGVISCASVDNNRNVSSFSDVNDRVALFSPGESWIVETAGSLNVVAGTSFSAPYAAGLAALILNKRRIELGNTTFRYTRTEMVDLLKTAIGVPTTIPTRPSSTSTSTSISTSTSTSTNNNNNTTTSTTPTTTSTTSTSIGTNNTAISTTWTLILLVIVALLFVILLFSLGLKYSDKSSSKL